MEYNNENCFASQLPQPKTRIQSPQKPHEKLHEMTASANNARPSIMPPPSGPLKRKTLMERAGEPIGRSAPVPPSSRPASAAGRPNPMAQNSRQTSFSSSVSSMRPPSTTSIRYPSSGSITSSAGSGYRTASSQSYRPQSAMAGPRTHKSLQSIGRPLTAMEVHSGAPGTGRAVGDQKGMPPFSLNPKGNPRGHKDMVTHGSDETHMSYASAWASEYNAARSIRNSSLCTAFDGLRLDDTGRRPTSVVGQDAPSTPSQIPTPVQKPVDQGVLPQTPLPRSATISPCKSSKKTNKALPKFLTRSSNTEIAWDTDSRLEMVESQFTELKGQMSLITDEGNSMKDMITMYRTKNEELEETRRQLQSSNAELRTSLDAVKAQLNTSITVVEDSKRYHNITLDDMQRQHRRELDDVRRDKDEDLRRELRRHQDEVDDVRRQLQNALEEERSLRQKEIQSLTSDGALSQQKLELELEKQQNFIQSIRDELQQSQADVDRERRLNDDLRSQLSEASSNALKLETGMSTLRAHITFLESDNKSQSHAFADQEMRMQNAIRSASEANEKLRTEETLRRKLHNQVQELKGNIRVFCRVRPPLQTDSEAARIKYPDNESDSREVEVLGQPEKSSLGTITTKTNAFAFDRVFGPQSANADVFGEISQLVQSALDGYNVCIFCYGQTGSGKTYTMSSVDGMIPLAVNQIYSTAKALEEKGWKYSMEGSFVEVYNENLNDLLGKADDMDKKKHEIRHDMQRCKTTITDVTVVHLDSPNKVESILRDASANRSVAATNANERSSRSHSVFILKLIGENCVTGERSEGTLNLVDLAGSERLSHSGATGERLKETQSINKSLSCLGDVIGALGQGKEGGHVPYRNSKLTYLLQFSLGGNSKTLMFVMISPLQAHLSETLTSLKFATKVHNTHIGTAKRQTKTKD